jgi:hypothetical protein
MAACLQCIHAHVSSVRPPADWHRSMAVTAAQALAGQDDMALRERLAKALKDLSTDLLEHLQYEEDHISDTLRTWPGWPFW